ncbi:MAG: UDP-N-acetylmuramate dehydrogenase [Clostridiales bacterium]|nr:UDP-N-acetylmuramate dehydrogenase [Clostridiales bacterium]
MNNSLERVLEAAGASKCKWKEPMENHTTFRVGGPADLFVEPESGEALAAMVKICREEQIPFQIVGKGSNLLVGDGGYRGVIFHIGETMAEVHRTGTVLEAQAGITLSALAKFAWENGLTGLEFAAGIPGSLGGAVVMNAGAYDGEMKDVLTEARILDQNGELRWISLEEMELAYRSSRIMREGWVVLGARMNLTRGAGEEILAKMQDLAERRRSKQPLEYPSAGSTFKRPEGYFAGKLIQDAGLAGYSVGGACVSEKHCGFVINRDHATAADIRQVCLDVAAEVYRQTGVTLELEVRCLGDF